MTTERLDGWAYMVRSHREKEAAERAANPGPDLRDQEVLVRGHEIEFDKSVTKQSKAGKAAHLAREHGWLVKIGEATFRKADTPYNGAVRAGKEVTWRWSQGVSPDRRHYFSASSDLIIYDGWPIPSIAELEVGLAEHGHIEQD